MTYRPVVTRRNALVRASALAGINSVILGFDFLGTKKERKHLLGFAIHREDLTERSAAWLLSQLRFKSQVRDYGEDIPSNIAPFQKYHWGDYTTKPGHEYRYEVYAVMGDSADPELASRVTLDVTATSNTANGGRDVGVFFNRGVTATRAYRIRFGDDPPQKVADGAAFRWLSRGLEEALLDFIGEAEDGDELKIAIYEFEHERVIQALKAAKSRGVTLSIVYHATGDQQTRENEEHVRALGIAAKRVTPRTNVPNISHNKFIIHVREGRPRRVWTGSTNFTDNGFYHQTNVGLRFTAGPIAQAFDRYFAVLNEDLETTEMKKRVAELVASLGGDLEYGRFFFSPVKDQDQLDLACDMIEKAGDAVFISSPFGLAKPICDALNSNDHQIIEYGLVNATSRTGLVKALDRSINSAFTIGTSVREYDGRVWDSKVWEKGHRIHVKSMVTDPWGPKPRVLIGSANFSFPSVHRNDENAFYFEGDGRLAAIVTTELLRMFDHYKFRDFLKRTKAKPKARYLDESGNWNEPYFNRGEPKYRDREVFSAG